jgi:carboxynorspermidine decarboxylase
MRKKAKNRFEVKKLTFSELPTPCYIVDEALLEKNLKVLRGVMDRTGCRIVLAQKAFSMFNMYPLIGEYLSGTTASGLYEARLGYEEMGKENHVFSPAYRDDEIDEIVSLCDHIVFNSFSQAERFKGKVLRAGKKAGLRINPECSTQVGHAIYDPCSAGSRFGVTLEHFRPELLDGISGFHFHTLCQQNSDDLARTLDAVEEKFGPWLSRLEWINFGGGHHITREDYDIPLLEACIRRMQDKYGLQVYLEPGEAVALNAGYLATSVLDTNQNGIDIAILDTSASCHMPDVLEMPYRPPLFGSGEPGEKPYTYRLGGQTCLTGDIIGDYSFDEPLKPGDRLVFGDMAIYSMVKNTTFNGMPLPAIVLKDSAGDYEIVKQFGYEDFKMRLAKKTAPNYTLIKNQALR